MECNHPGQMKHEGQWLTYSCGQCLPCRIKKQSSWEFRNRMEFLTSHSSSFLTLTIADNKMQEWASRPPGYWLRRFFDALRRLESRHGNRNPIRYFGCLEYGETYGRPHYHMLVYNQVKSFLAPTPRSNGMPSSLHSLKQWPHGHVDAGTVTTASIRYVASYILKESSQSPVTLFRTIRPGIGASGISKLADSAVTTLGKSVPMPTYFQLGERKFPLTNFERSIYQKRVHELGARIQEISAHEKTLLRLSFDQAKIEAGVYEKSAQKQREFLERIKLDGEKKAQKELHISAIYDKLQADRAYTALSAPLLAD